MNQETIQQSEKPIFEEKIERDVSNFKTGEIYKIIGGVKAVSSQEDIQQIASVCSQEEIYNTLFKDMCEGKPYSYEDAKDFIEWAKNGWNEGSHFVFFVRNSNNNIIGAIDIKSSNLNRAEVGYWADANSSGFMTNALMELCSIAKGANYKMLFGEALIKNTKSQQVLERAGFNYIGTTLKKDGEYKIFEKNLVNN